MSLTPAPSSGATELLDVLADATDQASLKIDHIRHSPSLEDPETSFPVKEWPRIEARIRVSPNDTLAAVVRIEPSLDDDGFDPDATYPSLSDHIKGWLVIVEWTKASLGNQDGPFLRDVATHLPDSFSPDPDRGRLFDENAIAEADEFSEALYAFSDAITTLNETRADTISDPE